MIQTVQAGESQTGDQGEIDVSLEKIPRMRWILISTSIAEWRVWIFIKLFVYQNGHAEALKDIVSLPVDLTLTLSWLDHVQGTGEGINKLGRQEAFVPFVNWEMV